MGAQPSFAGRFVGADRQFVIDTWLHVDPRFPEQAMFAHVGLRKWSWFPQEYAAWDPWGGIKTGRTPKPWHSDQWPSDQFITVGDSPLRFYYPPLCPVWQCVATDTPFDYSPLANATLDRLNAIGRDLFQLQIDLLDYSDSFQLRAQWWEALAQHVEA